MNYPVYCIRDTKVGFDTQFLVQANEASAIRGFSYMVNNPNGMPNFAPADYELYKIGDFDTESGVFTSTVPCQFVVSGASVYGDRKE